MDARLCMVVMFILFASSTNFLNSFFVKTFCTKKKKKKKKITSPLNPSLLISPTFAIEDPNLDPSCESPSKNDLWSNPFWKIKKSVQILLLLLFSLIDSNKFDLYLSKYMIVLTAENLHQNTTAGSHRSSLAHQILVDNKN